MLPDINTGPAIAREIVQDRLRQAAHQRMLNSLPQKPTRGLRFRCRIADSVGESLVSLGERLLSYGDRRLTGAALTASVRHQ